MTTYKTISPAGQLIKAEHTSYSWCIRGGRYRDRPCLLVSWLAGSAVSRRDDLLATTPAWPLTTREAPSPPVPVSEQRPNVASPERVSLVRAATLDAIAVNGFQDAGSATIRLRYSLLRTNTVPFSLHGAGAGA